MGCRVFLECGFFSFRSCHVDVFRITRMSAGVSVWHINMLAPSTACRGCLAVVPCMLCSAQALGPIPPTCSCGKRSNHWSPHCGNPLFLTICTAHPLRRPPCLQRYSNYGQMLAPRARLRIRLRPQRSPGTSGITMRESESNRLFAVQSQIALVIMSSGSTARRSSVRR